MPWNTHGGRKITHESDEAMKQEGVPVSLLDVRGNRTQNSGMPPVVLALGFRIFFLLGALSAVVLVPLWTAVYAFGVPLPAGVQPMQWHAHEMLFGFVAAIMAGFLLTAPGTWTGRPMPKGATLGGLALLWLAGRVLPFFPGFFPGWMLLVVDAAFLPTLGWVVFRFLRGLPGQRHNLVFPILLAVMTTANVLAHLQIRNRWGVAVGTECMLYLVLILISLVGGRVIPGFTQGQFPRGSTQLHPVLDWWSVGLLIVLMAVDVSGAPPLWVAGFSLLAAGVHAARLAGWFTREVVDAPLLWVLHLGYGWLVLGLFMKAGAQAGLCPPLLARHAFTVGTAGGIILGMISRVTLGHTGRPMRLPRFMTTAFVLINLAAALRVVLPWVDPGRQLLWLKLSALAWTGAYGLFLLREGPFLWQPRSDGRPG